MWVQGGHSEWAWGVTQLLEVTLELYLKGRDLFKKNLDSSPRTFFFTAFRERERERETSMQEKSSGQGLNLQPCGYGMMFRPTSWGQGGAF